MRVLTRSAQLFNTPKNPPPDVIPVIAAYDIFAPDYRAYSEGKKRYLERVEDIIIDRIGSVRSMLDVGAGDGRRALRISRAAGVDHLVLLEPSVGMRVRCPDGVEIRPFQISEMPPVAREFEVITMLWNVLGHLRDNGERQIALARIRNILSPGGAVFLDVSHRYNAAAYGRRRTLLRVIHDFCRPSEKHGDVVISWKSGSGTIRTHGHLFTHAEIKSLCRSAGLKIARRWVIDYETGEECRLSVSGHLLYQLIVA